MRESRTYWLHHVFSFSVLACFALLVPREVFGQANWGPNRVRNASFEEQLDYWNPRVGARQEGDEVTSDVDIDSTVANTGVYSLKLSGHAKTTKWWAIESEPIPATPGKRYRFGAYMKTENVRQEEGQYLNANVYLQFRDKKGQVLEIAGAPVRGTQPLTDTRDWVNLYAYVVAPERTAQARIGCALTCSGTAWFDDITFQESEDVTWASTRTKNIAYFHALDDTPPEDVLEENKKMVVRLLEILGEKPGLQIRFFKYRNATEMNDVRGYDAQASAAEDAVHSIRWVAPPFNVARILAGRWGESTRLLDEGIATYAVDTLAGTDLHEKARELARADTLPILFEETDVPKILLGISAPGRNPVYGSFVGWLIEAQGIDQFKKVYGYADRIVATNEFPNKFKQTYGMTPAEAEAEWRKFLRNE
jgi:hypothetical protein